MRVHFATMRFLSVGDVKLPVIACVTLVGLCACEGGCDRGQVEEASKEKKRRDATHNRAAPAPSRSSCTPWSPACQQEAARAHPAPSGRKDDRYKRKRFTQSDGRARQSVRRSLTLTGCGDPALSACGVAPSRLVIFPPSSRKHNSGPLSGPLNRAVAPPMATYHTHRLERHRHRSYRRRGAMQKWQEAMGCH